MAQTGAGAAREALERDFPDVVLIERGEQVRTVLGRPMTTGATPREAMEDWLFLYGDVFGVDELEWVEARGSEISNGRVAFALQQQVAVDGGGGGGIPARLPIEGGRLRVLAASDGEDFAITYVAARVKYHDGSVAAPRITGAQAIAAAGEDERTQHLEIWAEPELIAIEMDLGAGPEVFAAWRMTGQESEEAFHSALIVYVDAVLREVVLVAPGLSNSDPVTGTVEGKATAGHGPPLPGTVAVAALPDLMVQIPYVDLTNTDGDGAYELTAAAQSVDVETMLDAGFWTVFDEVNSVSEPPVLGQTGVTPPASGVDFLFNPSPSSQEDVAPVNAYLHVRNSNAFFDALQPTWASQILPNLPHIRVRANVACTGSGACNAFFQHFDATSTLTFCLDEENECNNAAYSTIISHEYGHYIVWHIIGEQHNTPFHEGYADSFAILVHDTGIIGSDFYLSDPGVPSFPHIREPHAAGITFPACECGPFATGCTHANGQLLGGLWWDIRLNADPFDPAVSLAIARQLFADWTFLATGGTFLQLSECVAQQPATTDTLIEVLIADDDDNDITNGTPNDEVICWAFCERGINTSFTGSPCGSCARHGGGCRADLNYDGVLDVFDFIEFHLMFTSGDLFCDFTGDGELDVFDFLEFQNEVAAGCGQ